jgi:hypothetical protein
LQPGTRSRRPRRTRLLRQDACLTAPAPTSTHSTESPGRFPQPGPLREQLAPQSIPFASIVRCLVALVARRRATASSAGTVGHRASFNHGTSAEPAKDAPPLSPRARSDLGDCRGPLPHPHDSARLGPRPTDAARDEQRQRGSGVPALLLVVGIQERWVACRGGRRGCFCTGPGGSLDGETDGGGVVCELSVAGGQDRLVDLADGLGGGLALGSKRRLD